MNGDSLEKLVDQQSNSTMEPLLARTQSQRSPSLGKSALRKQNTKLGQEEGELFISSLARRPTLTLDGIQKGKSQKQVDILSPTDEADDEHEELQTHKSEIHAIRKTTPLPYIGIQVPIQVLPIGLVTITIAGAVCMLLLQCQILHDLLKSNVINYVFGFLYIVTLGCMSYCMLGSPGLVPVPKDFSEDDPLPQRAHKTWLYDKPIYRYDHYCRWLMNCIGLMNHREFMIMLIGLVAISVAGACVDVILIFVEAFVGAWGVVVALVLHLGYSLLKLRFVGQILKMHVGFVSRNELCAEWKDDLFWRVQPTTVFLLDEEHKGKKMLKDMTPEELELFEEGDQLDGFLVRELSVDTYNVMLPETNRYDPGLNLRDLGWNHNCFTFWLAPRWTKDRHEVF